MSQRTTNIFISYAHRYKEWVETLVENLEACMGGRTRVFLDSKDLEGGISWVGQLQAELNRADYLVLIATPEALASPRVSDEWESFVAERPEWQGFLQVLLLAETPLPPFLKKTQVIDFRQHNTAGYRRQLCRLLSRFGLDESVARQSVEAIDPPPPPSVGLPPELRSAIVKVCVPFFVQKICRRVIANALDLGSNELEGHPSNECTASAALVRATGDDNAVEGARRLMSILKDECREVVPIQAMENLGRFTRRLDRLVPETLAPEYGLLKLWCQWIEGNFATLTPFFARNEQRIFLNEVYVRRELRLERHTAETAGEFQGPFEQRIGIEQLLGMDPQGEPWVTRRWILLGETGVGKTMFLHHLAWRIARDRDTSWVPVFETLPRLLDKEEWLLSRLSRELAQAGYASRGLETALERVAKEGRLLLLLDGLDEVPADRRESAERLLRELSKRWPVTPVIVSSRPLGYRRPCSEFREIELLALDHANRGEFLIRWSAVHELIPGPFNADEMLRCLEADSTLWELSSNPLYLTLIALLWNEQETRSWHRVWLYDRLFDALIEGRHRSTSERRNFPMAVRRALRYLAHGMTQDNHDTEPVENLEMRLYMPEAGELRELLEAVPRWRKNLRLVLDDISQHTGILGPQEGSDSAWKFWHPSFREALTAERLSEMYLQGRQSTILSHVRQIAGSESRWAEPYALLAGRLDDPDALVRTLVEENLELGLLALANVKEVNEGTLDHILERSSEWKQRAPVFLRVPDLMSDPERALRLLDRLRRRTRSGNDLFFLERALDGVGRRWPGIVKEAGQARARLYDHIPVPPEEMLRWVETPRDGRVKLFREVPPGSFWMGSLKGEGDDSEHPQHRVDVVKSFAIAAVPVTNALYACFDPGHQQREWVDVSEAELPFHPVVRVSWFEAMSFCRWLSYTLPQMQGLRLPNEAEWEYACRAGTSTSYWSGDTEADLARVGWYGGALANHRTHRVGEKLANPWGLYDIHGNVWEWTCSVWTEDYSERQSGLRMDPLEFVEEETNLADPTSVRRAVRGGGFWYWPQGARAAYRRGCDPFIVDWGLGFRVVLPAVPLDE